MPPSTALMSRLVQRRLDCRLNQRRYRARLKEKKALQDAIIQEWQDKVDCVKAYKNLLRHGTLLKQTRFTEFRGVIVQMFAQLFANGVNSTQSHKYAAQASFLQFNLDRDCCHGVEVILAHFEKYTLIHREFQLKFQSIKCLEPTIFQLSLLAKMTLTRATIAALYPHMLFDRKFLDQIAAGRKLQYRINIRFHFAPNTNKIVHIQFEHQLAQGWCTLLKNFHLTARVLNGTKIQTDTTFIPISFDSLLEILNEYHSF